MNTARIKRKARSLFELEDRHGKPAPGHYLWWGTAIAVPLAIEYAFRPMQTVLDSVPMPAWAWYIAAFLMFVVVPVAFALRHKPLGWSRTYRRTFRRGSFAHGVAAWIRDATLTYACLLPLACVFMALRA